MTVLVMSEKELSRIDTLDRVLEGRLSATQAASIMALSRRQVHRLLNAYRQHGVAALISKKRGKPSNRTHDPAFHQHTLQLVRDLYADFGPTFAAEKLAECHDVRVAKETLRQWMIADGLWMTRRERARRVHQPRYRRPCVGELVQIDGCEHYWFENRGPQCTLLVFVDDATSRLQHLSFAASESTFDYMRAVTVYVERFGKPVAFYSDKHNIFRVNQKSTRQNGPRITQFGRALHELNIDILCANSSQAKGRVERAHLTLQDRLVKELRLADVSTIEDGNAFLPGFIDHYNAKFAKPPRSDRDLHRAIAEHENVDDVMCIKHERSVTVNLTFQYDRMQILLEPNDFTAGLAKKRVMIHDYPDGRLKVIYRSRELPFRTFDKVRQIEAGAIIDNKRLGAALAYAAELQRNNPTRRASSGPRRRGQHNSIFASDDVAA